MSITLKQAKNLKHGDVLHHATAKNSNGTPQKWRVSGKVKRWKRSPDKIRVPLRRGLCEFGLLTEDDLNLVSLAD